MSSTNCSAAWAPRRVVDPGALQEHREKGHNGGAIPGTCTEVAQEDPASVRRMPASSFIDRAWRGVRGGLRPMARVPRCGDATSAGTGGPRARCCRRIRIASAGGVRRGPRSSRRSPTSLEIGEVTTANWPGMGTCGGAVGVVVDETPWRDKPPTRLRTATERCLPRTVWMTQQRATAADRRCCASRGGSARHHRGRAPRPGQGNRRLPDGCASERAPGRRWDVASHRGELVCCVTSLNHRSSRCPLDGAEHSRPTRPQASRRWLT